MKKYYLNVREPIINHKHKIVGYKNLRIYVEKEVYLEWHSYTNKENYADERMRSGDHVSFDRLEKESDLVLTERQRKIWLEKTSSKNMDGVSSSMSTKKLRKKIDCAIKQLPNIQKRRFVLHVIHGMSIREIAQKENKQEVSIYQSIQRARASIMNYLNTND